MEEPLPLEISEDIQPEEKKRHVARTKTTEVNIIFIHIIKAFVMLVSMFRNNLWGLGTK